MAIKYQALLSPIELKGENLIVSVVGETTFVYTPTVWVMPNIFALLKDIQDQEPSHLTFEINKDLKVVATSSTGNIASVSSGAVNTALGTLTADATQTVETAAYKPPNNWFPRYRANDGRWFQYEADGAFSGTRGVNGNLSGIGYDIRRSREFSWPYEPAISAVVDANGDETTDSQALKYNCFEYVIDYARRRSAEHVTTGNLNLKGLYYIDDLYGDYVDGNNFEDSWGDGSANNSKYVWVTPDAGNIGANSNNRMNSWYDVSVRLTTASSPDTGWDVS